MATGDENMDSDCEESDDDYYYNNENSYYTDEEDECMNAWLVRDLMLFRQHYGNSAVQFISYEGIGMADVNIFIKPTILQKETCDAWGINYSEDIVVRLHFSSSKYILGPVPTVNVFQSLFGDKFLLRKQIKNIVEKFVHKNWKETFQAYSRQNDPCNDCRLSKDQSDFYESIMTLVNMGFSIERASKACELFSGKLNEALELLLNDENGCLIDDAVCCSVVEEVKEGPSCADTAKSSENDKAWSGFHDDLHLVPPMSSSRPAKIKSVPSLKNGFLVQLYQFIVQRIPTLNEFCVVCDEPHVFQNGPMLKPTLCARELCCFSNRCLGVMADVVSDIASGAEVVDLHLAIATAACSSKRRELVFDPFPSIVNPNNPREFIISPKKRDYGRVLKALATIPTMKELTSWNPSDLKSELDKSDPLSYPLTQWIIFSNRCHIIKLPKDMQLKFMHTPHQFLLLSSPPAKEQSFLEAKQTFGVTYAFHGSHIENWHSIMRMGLLNASGTKHQLHGAAFGKGIYLSPCSGVSFGYSNMGWGKYCLRNGKVFDKDTSSRFLRSKNLNCIALCEVVNSTGLTKATPSVWVCSNSDHVCTRFFFVYEDGRVGDLSVNTEVQPYKNEIAKAVQSYKQIFRRHLTDLDV